MKLSHGRAQLRRTALALALVVLPCTLVAEGVGRADKKIIARMKSMFSEIIVFDEGKYRCFHFKGGLPYQSCMNRKDQAKVRFEYIRMMFGAITLAPKQGRILVLGLGAGTLVKLIQKFYPRAHLDVVELVPAVHRMALRYFALKPAARTTIHIMDAHDFVLKKAKHKYDLVLMDCFDAKFVPPKLRTLRFTRGLHRILTPTGRVATNIFSDHAEYDNVMWAYQRIFPTLWVMKGSTSGNAIVVGSTGKGDRTLMQWLKHARSEGQRMRVPFSLRLQVSKLVPVVTGWGLPAAKPVPQSPGQGPDPCGELAGRWVGQMRYAHDDHSVHYFDGTVARRGTRCSARFNVRFSRKWVVERFKVQLTGRDAAFVGTGLEGSSSTRGYWLDTFKGKLDAASRQFSGSWSDRGNNHGTFVFFRR